MKGRRKGDADGMSKQKTFSSSLTGSLGVWPRRREHNESLDKHTHLAILFLSQRKTIQSPFAPPARNNGSALIACYLLLSPLSH